ncbi:hypothetical protein KVK91_04585 [Helicobacter pylori]|nr:hypothetical protein KVK91_04585 [Helicobacter pylori]
MYKNCVFIIESPNKIAKIKELTGSSFVFATGGHFVELVNIEVNIEIDLKKDLQELLYILDSNAGNRKILNDLKKTNQETYKEEYLKTKIKKESEKVQYV